MRSTTRGSVIMEIIFISAPQEQSMGLTSKILRSRRAHVRRVSLVNSESSSSVEEGAALPEKSRANGELTLPLERLL